RFFTAREMPPLLAAPPAGQVGPNPVTERFCRFSVATPLRPLGRRPPNAKDWTMTNKMLMAVAVTVLWTSTALAVPALPTARAAMDLVLACGEHGATCTSNADCCS